MIRVGYLQVKVDLFVPCGVLGATSSATPVTAAKLLRSVFVADKKSTKDSVMDLRCALMARVLTHLPLKIAQSGRRRKRFNVYALRNASLSRKVVFILLSARQICPECLRIFHDPVKAGFVSGRPGSASAGTQASPEVLRTGSARIP